MLCLQLRAHELEALKAGCGVLSPDSPPLPGDRALLTGSPEGESADLCATKAEALGQAQHGSQQAGSTPGPDLLIAAAAANPGNAGPCNSSARPAQGRRALNAAAAGSKRRWPAEAKADGDAEAACAEAKPKRRRQAALPAADLPVLVPATADSGCQTDEVVLVAHKHEGRVTFVLPDLQRAAQYPVPHSAWQSSMLPVLQAEAAIWSGHPQGFPGAVSTRLAAATTAALGRTGLTMQDLQQHLRHQATQVVPGSAQAIRLSRADPRMQNPAPAPCQAPLLQATVPGSCATKLPSRRLSFSAADVERRQRSGNLALALPGRLPILPLELLPMPPAPTGQASMLMPASRDCCRHALWDVGIIKASYLVWASLSSTSGRICTIHS